MPYDFIKHTKGITKSLKQAGYESMAEQIENALLMGSTSGEILMALRHECRIAQSISAMPTQIKTDILKLVSKIDEVSI